MSTELLPGRPGDRPPRCSASPPPARSTTASPPWSAGCCTTPSRSSPTSSTPSSTSADRGFGGPSAAALDLALLTDGLRAEREQGITIDVAYRYFATDRPLLHPGRLPRARAVHPQHGHRRVHRRRRRAARRRPQGRPRADPPPPRRGRAAAGAARGGGREQDRPGRLRRGRLRARRGRRRRGRRRARPRRDAARPCRSRRSTATTSSTAPPAPPGTPARACSSCWRPFRSPTTRARRRSASRCSSSSRPQERRRATPAHRDYRGYAGQIASGVVRVGDEVVVLPCGRAHDRRRHRLRRTASSPRPSRRSRWRCGSPTTSTSPAAT